MSSPRRELFIAALACFALGSCATYESGIEVSVSVSASSEGALRQVWLLDGTELTMNRATLTVRSASLVACGGHGSHMHEARRLILGLPMLAVAQHMHGGGASLEAPLVVDFASELESMEGLLRPPAGTYCGVLLTLEGLSIDAIAADGRTLRAASTGSFVANIEFAEPLVLSERGRTELRFALANASPFALTTMLPAAGEEAGDSILGGIAAQAHSLGVLPVEAER